VLNVLDIGWLPDDPHGPCWTFPECDAAGQVIGISRRYGNGNKKLLPGGRRGLTIPDKWQEGQGPILLPEGPSDTLALTAMGLSAVGRPSNTGGVSLLADLLAAVPASRPIIVLGEWDVKENGDWPGRDGAVWTAAELSGCLHRPAEWAMPPDHAKDVRAWSLDRRPESAGMEKRRQRGEELMRRLQRNHPSGRPEMKVALPEPEGISAADLLVAELPEPRWAVAGLLPEGASILAGKPKGGKSWLALNLALAVASGGTALGGVPVDSGDVLYLALEDTQRRLKKRLQRLLRPTGAAPARLTLHTHWRRMEEGGLLDLVKWLADHPEARLVVIDTLAKVRSDTRRDTVYQQDYEVISCVKAIADKHGVTILLIHHVRKMDADDPFDTVSGTLGLTGAADGILVLRRQRGTAEAVLHLAGRDVDEQQLALRWEAETGQWHNLGPAEQHTSGREQARVLELLRRAGEPIKPKEVALLLDRGEGATRTLLVRMADKGLVTSRNGTYQPGVEAEAGE
jgi:hypothetical protein